MNRMHERPGVYLDEGNSGIGRRASGLAVGIVAQAQTGEINRLYSVASPSDGKRLFGEGGLSELCAAALENGAAKVLAVPASEDYAQAFALLEQEEICVLVSGSSAGDTGQKLVESVERSAQMGLERLGAAACPVENSLEWVYSLHSGRLLLTAQRAVNGAGGEAHPALLAAALAGKVALFTSGERSINGSRLENIAGLAGNLTEEEIDTLVRAGITPVEQTGGQVCVVRAVVTDTKNGFTELFTQLAVDRTISAVREGLRKLLPGLKNTVAVRSALAARAAALLEEKRREKWLQSFEAPQVAPHESDPALCVVRIRFTVAQGLNRILLSVQVTI